MIRWPLLAVRGTAAFGHPCPSEFIGLAAQHIPVPRIRLIRYFGLYSSKSRGKWPTPFRTSCAASAFEHPVQQNDWDHVVKHAPEGWKEQYGIGTEEEAEEFEDTYDVDSLTHRKSKASWARLIQKVYEVDPMTCSKCGSEMKVIAIITSEFEVKKILRHLAKTGKSPPGLTEGS